MLTLLNSKLKEYHSLALAVIFILSNFIVRITILFTFRIFGVERDKIQVRHLETYLWSITLIIAIMIAGAYKWPELSWALMIIGLIRIIQILSLYLQFMYFDFRLFASSVTDKVRTRWFVISLGFALLDISLIYGFFYYFLNKNYGILSIHTDKFIDYYYFAIVTMGTVGYGDIVPVSELGRLLVISQILIDIFLFFLLITTVTAHYQRLYEKI